MISYLCIFIVYTKKHFTLKYTTFLKNLDSTTFEIKMPYHVEYDIKIILHFLAQPNLSYPSGRIVVRTWYEVSTGTPRGF